MESREKLFYLRTKTLDFQKRKIQKINKHAFSVSKTAFVNGN